jgi:hypothetical protein
MIENRVLHEFRESHGSPLQSEVALPEERTSACPQQHVYYFLRVCSLSSAQQVKHVFADMARNEHVCLGVKQIFHDRWVTVCNGAKCFFCVQLWDWLPI